ncbi:hypothetical protein VPNG_03673 [Cytospora leucostoma]|uniref:Uncharacterized protein n=1 Tax=Cytospora leucostoma TaxID=1230097 RepID=A0A423XF75_9PEZI|nr:hypothetical protein VPNG_03673 [Cytospora leucostoma]
MAPGVEDWGAKLSSIQYKYHDKAIQAMLELRQAEANELRRLQQELRGANGNIGNESSVESQMSVSRTMSAGTSSSGTPSSLSTLMDATLTDVDDAFATIPLNSRKSYLSPNTVLPRIVNTAADGSGSNRLNSHISPRLSLRHRIRNDTWRTSKHRRAETTVAYNGCGDDDGSLSSSSVEDIPARVHRILDKSNEQPECSSSAACGASPAKHRAIASTAEHSRQDYDDHISDDTSRGTMNLTSQGIRRNAARGARPEPGSLKMKRPPRQKRR